MKRRYVTSEDLRRIGTAVTLLKAARAELGTSGARSARRYVGRAIKSAEGAQRHAANVWRRQEREAAV